MSNIEDNFWEHGLKKLQTTNNQEPKNSGCADLFHDIPVRGLLSRFYATCSENEEKKRRIKIDQGLIGRIPISTNTAFRSMNCCINLDYIYIIEIHLLHSILLVPSAETPFQNPGTRIVAEVPWDFAQKSRPKSKLTSLASLCHRYWERLRHTSHGNNGALAVQPKVPKSVATISLHNKSVGRNAATDLHEITLWLFMWLVSQGKQCLGPRVIWDLSRASKTWKDSS